MGEALAEYELKVLRAFASSMVDDLEQGAALNAASEFLSRNGYLNLHNGSATAKGHRAILEDDCAKLRAELDALEEEQCGYDDEISKAHERAEKATAELAAVRHAAVRHAAIREAAKFVAKRRDAYVEEHGFYDPTTGAIEFPGNGDEYVGELDEIEEGILALSAAGETR